MRVSNDAAFFDDFNFVLMHHRRVGGSFEAAVQGKFFVPVIWTLSAVLAAAPARAASETVAPPADDIADLSLEQLGNIVVTSVSRQEERLSNAAASIFIISASDIRRSGAQSIPEALRLAPNLQVAQVDGRNYAITARGFNSPFENKLLVMIDGRSVYSPLFSGVFWDAQDVVMEDIERIEVISGPGATIWGTNAVNGVINVITRSARDTQGGLLATAGGDHQKNGSARYGGELPGGGSYRAYAKFAEVDDTRTAAGIDTGTGMRHTQAGFRADWDLDRGGMTLSGDAYQGTLGQLGTRDIYTEGANLVGRYTRKLADDSDLRLEAILDHTERNQPGAFVERLSTLDLEAQHGVRIGERHNVSWGGGYRYSWDDVSNGSAFGFLPGQLALHWANVFAQDEITLRPGLKLTAGLRVEENNYTGAEYLPSVRLAWTPAADQLLWSSLSRTVRSPSRIDRDLYSPTTPVLIGGVPRYVIGGGPDFQSEVAKVLELGYRAQPLPALSYSITAYVSSYDRLRTLEPQTDPNAGALSVFSNMGEGSEHGIEMWGRWQLAPAWRINAGAVFQHVQTDLKPGSLDTSGSSGLATDDPARHWLLRSSHDLSERSQLDLTLRYTSALPTPAVAAYYEMDAQWMWQPRPNVNVALIGQNLLHDAHAEFGTAPGGSVIERSVLLKLTLRF